MQFAFAAYREPLGSADTLSDQYRQVLQTFDLLCALWAAKSPNGVELEISACLGLNRIGKPRERLDLGGQSKPVLPLPVVRVAGTFV